MKTESAAKSVLQKWMGDFMTNVEAQKQLLMIFSYYTDSVRVPSEASREAIAMAIAALECTNCPHKNTV